MSDKVNGNNPGSIFGPVWALEIKISFPKLLGEFKPNLMRMFIGWSST
jgi:hypothetical protein